MSNTNYSENESKFSSDFACLWRIHSLLIDCNNYSRMAIASNEKLFYLNSWYATVRVLFREIMPNLSEDDKSKLNSELENILKCWNIIKSVGSLYSVDRTPEGVNNFINITKFEIFYNNLSKIEMGLRFIATYKKMLLNSKRGIVFTMGEEE